MDVQRGITDSTRKRAAPAAALTAVVLLTAAVTCFSRSAASIDVSTITVDTVRRGLFVREVRAAGSLVPEQVRWIAALSAGRVERVHVQPGAQVSAGMVLLEMTNPDVRLEVLEAERQLSAAEAALVNLQASLETQRLAQASTVASVRSQQREATRQATAKRELVDKQLITSMEAAHAVDQAEELNHRLGFEEERLRIVTHAADTQLAVQRAEIGRLREIVRFYHARLDALTVRATHAGVVQDIPSETGQWVNPGETLVKQHSTGKLKAVLRVPGLEAMDVARGQSVQIDTRNGVVQGRVLNVNPGVQGGVVLVDVALPDNLPAGSRPDLSIDGVIEVERVPNTLHVSRMPDAEPQRRISVFKLDKDGRGATRTDVQIGRVSTTAAEIRDGLQAGDVVIVSTLSSAHDESHIRIRN
jgi:HlyD family secretion protein